jgi:surfactin synthase thioesterase subunit
LLPLARAVPDACVVTLLELNDRADPASCFAEATARLRPDFESLVDRPAIVFGHSMGALLAHALVAALPGDRWPLVTDVVLSGSRSPGTTAKIAGFPPAAFVSRSRDDLTHDLGRYGSCPAEVLDDPQLLDLAVTALGQDMHLIDTYVEPSGPGEDDRRTEYHVWFGTDDDEASAAEARVWAASTPRRPRLRAFPGRHFYLLEHPDAGLALRQLITRRLATGAGHVDGTCRGGRT